MHMKEARTAMRQTKTFSESVINIPMLEIWFLKLIKTNLNSRLNLFRDLLKFQTAKNPAILLYHICIILLDL